MTRAPDPQTPQRERGAALITVLFLVVILSTVALSMTDDVSYAVRRSAAQHNTEQARWFALGAETLALETLRASLAANPNRITLNQPWATEAGRFAIPGGFIDGRLSDAGNCFNINSLIPNAEDRDAEADPRITAQFQKLLLAIGLAEGEIAAIQGPLVDWIDPDGRPSDRGAEDFDYLGLPVPYRTPNTLIADISELRALSAMTPGLYTRLAPFLCALPTRQPATLNANTLSPEQLPLIAMLIGGDETPALDRLLEIVTSRPGGGYASAQDFWALPSFEGLQISDADRQQVDVRTRYFRLNARVAYTDAFVQIVSLIDAVQADVIEVRWREIGLLQ